MKAIIHAYSSINHNNINNMKEKGKIMLEYCELKTRDGETRFQGHYRSMTACLEDALHQGVNLRGLKLAGYNLSHGNFDGGDFSGSDFSRCNMTGANLSEAVLDHCLFSHASLVDICLAESRIHGCMFHEASFSATDVAGASLEDCVFSCPSFFQLKLHDTAHFKNCRYFHDGQYCAIETRPFVLQGLPQLIAVMDAHIMIGHHVKTIEDWRRGYACDRQKGALIPLSMQDRQYSFFRRYENLIETLYAQRMAADITRADHIKVHNAQDRQFDSCHEVN